MSLGTNNINIMNIFYLMRTGCSHRFANPGLRPPPSRGSARNGGELW